MNATPDTTTPTLTKDDIAAIKGARSVAFHYHDGRYYARAHKEIGYGKPIVWSAKDQLLYPTIWAGPDWRAREIEISQRLSGISAYGEYGESVRATPVSAYASGHAYDATWETVKSFLRVGDTLAVRFIADNNNAVIREANLHSDEMQVIIVRGKQRFTFSIAHSIAPNNSARMVRFE